MRRWPTHVSEGHEQVCVDHTGGVQSGMAVIRHTFWPVCDGCQLLAGNRQHFWCKVEGEPAQQWQVQIRPQEAHR